VSRITAKPGMRIIYKGHEATVLATARDYSDQDYSSWVKVRFDAWWQPTRWIYCGGSVYQIDQWQTDRGEGPIPSGQSSET
jgi:hypothetical protein